VSHVGRSDIKAQIKSGAADQQILKRYREAASRLFPFDLPGQPGDLKRSGIYD